MKYDIVILSYSKTVEHIKVTRQCIDSLLSAKNKIGVNIYVIESYDPTIKYTGAKTIYFSEKTFNYNRSMNKGFSFTTNQYVFFCNNDLVFYDDWADNCYHVFKMGYDSLSPYCPVSHPRFITDGNYAVAGYQVGFMVAGWCIGVNRDMFERIGGFNEAVTFWYSDNLYAEQLKIAEVKHALVCNSFVKHLDFGSKTLKTMSANEKTRMTSAQKSKYDKEVKKLYAKKEKVLR